MGFFDLIRNFFIRKKEEDVVIIQPKQEPFKKETEPMIPKEEMLTADRETYLLERKAQLEAELSQINEELEAMKIEEEKPAREDIPFTSSESQLRDRVYAKITDIPQMTLTEFKEVVRNPNQREQEKYGLNAQGFGAQHDNILKRIWQYKKFGGL